MKRVLTAVVLVPLVLLVVFRAPLWLFSLVIAAIVMLALSEYLGIAKAAGLKPFRFATYLISVLLLFFTWKTFTPHPRQFQPYGSFETSWILAPLLPLIFGIQLVFGKDLKDGLSSIAASVFGILYVAGSLAILIAFRANPFENILIIFVLFSVWAGDIAAYYVGRTIGRHKLAPIVSPNKSWEGAIASVAASIVVALLVFHFGDNIDRWFLTHWTFYTRLNPIRISLPNGVLIGAVTNVAAQFGDLFESALKRGAGVKDSGTLLPGHGGVLDRIDALLFAIPVAWYYANLTGFLLPKF